MHRRRTLRRATAPARAGRNGDTGSVAVEAAILAPAVVMLVLIVALVGRIQSTGGVVDAAARAGARAASLERTREGAQQKAEAAMRDVLDRQHVACAELSVPPVVFTPGAGGLVTVHAEVRCTVRFDRLTLNGVPGRTELTGQFASVVDRYRGTG
ncbi:TadE/TadG family type IV pilus assembly protein [Kitasatospora sp. McL0602]|uniref:TadE/TadG family type IV pilus assembly protein n=1 Tax=Kitasatospora sp. McL0602 TaxID=3439530 RepID=UPI003F8A7BE6